MLLTKGLQTAFARFPNLTVVTTLTELSGMTHETILLMFILCLLLYPYFALYQTLCPFNRFSSSSLEGNKTGG
jgi:hypothetical protein